MKKTVLLLSALMYFGTSMAQNIDDNKVNFNYIQLPKIKIDDRFTTYEVRVEHSYKAANEDSLAMNKMRKEVALDIYERQLADYREAKDSIDRLYFSAMADWEIKQNAGVMGSDGQPLPQPSLPVYPIPPVPAEIGEPRLHSEISQDQVSNLINLQGFEQGMGGVIITIDILPIRNISIVSTKSGSGASTKFKYRCMYTLPVKVKVESPTQGTLSEETLFDNAQYYDMPDFKSQYEHLVYMMDNSDKFYSDLEASARAKAFSGANQYINENFGFITKARTAEIYSVKRHKNYDYSDVTNAYTKTVQALGLVKNDRDRSGAEEKLDEAISAWRSILEESNLSENSARINDKITAMIRCNLAELLVWRAEFDKSEMEANLAMNSNVGKARRHMDDEIGFYKDQRIRWEANY